MLWQQHYGTTDTTWDRMARKRLVGLTHGDGDALVQRRCFGGVDLAAAAPPAPVKRGVRFQWSGSVVGLAG
jgi:hypothetical protein